MGSGDRRGPADSARKSAATKPRSRARARANRFPMRFYLIAAVCVVLLQCHPVSAMKLRKKLPERGGPKMPKPPAKAAKPARKPAAKAAKPAGKPAAKPVDKRGDKKANKTAVLKFPELDKNGLFPCPLKGCVNGCSRCTNGKVTPEMFRYLQRNARLIGSGLPLKKCFRWLPHQP